MLIWVWRYQVPQFHKFLTETLIPVWVSSQSVRNRDLYKTTERSSKTLSVSCEGHTDVVITIIVDLFLVDFVLAVSPWAATANSKTISFLFLVCTAICLSFSWSWRVNIRIQIFTSHNKRWPATNLKGWEFCLDLLTMKLEVPNLYRKIENDIWKNVKKLHLCGTFDYHLNVFHYGRLLLF